MRIVTASESPAEDPAGVSSRRQRQTVIITSVTAFMVGLDVLVIMVALPTLLQTLRANASGLAWTVNAYEIGFAGALLTSSALGDRYGRRAVFIAGVAVFTAGSAWCALSSASGMGMLIVARAFQGIGGGTGMALGLAIVTVVTPPAKRGTAFGIWGAIMGIAVAVGPLIGGAILYFLPWQWIFWVNVPIGVTLIVLSFFSIEETKGDVRRLDLIGLIIATTAIVLLLQALIRVGSVRWYDPAMLVGLVAGIIGFFVFVRWEQRCSHPMIPLAMFRNKSFTGGCLASFALGAGLYGNAFIFTQYLELVLGANSIGVGLRLLPWVALAPFVAPVAGVLADRLGERPIVTAALAMFAAAFFTIGILVTSGQTYVTLIVPLLVAGIGVAAAFPTTATAVMRSMDPGRFAIASGVSTTIRQTGAGFGVALAVAMFSGFGGYGSGRQFFNGFGAAVYALAAITLLGVIPALIIPALKSRSAEPVPPSEILTGPARSS
ncbi:DHA2 family efflux MFS transporter permease subunit [Actinoallomurus rhizosphaericola]|uniref:DHA2 family efflux MFS transporter permease subunit n=1 Tax=Actinoallomurus rhizosphaericola TaxID=2952536 RepID=UPI0020934655|nr:DHA2 family efflux MFS transporter permease subunit [Actinoallomurus rhizosphaericola]MCO5998061.1 DHA2 family efflux MFS transporter permease subunit [Actinoallomurus rhizosphaericola]